MQRKYWLIAAFSIFIVIIFFSIRLFLINWIIDVAKNKIHHKFDVECSFQSYRLKGIFGIELHNLLMNNSDTLLLADTLYIRMNPLVIFAASKKIKEIKILNARATIFNNLIKKTISKDNDEYHFSKPTINNYIGQCHWITNQFFNYIPKQIFIKHFRIVYTDSTYQLKFDFKYLSKKDTTLKVDVTFSDNYVPEQSCLIFGNIDERKKNINFIVINNTNETIILPYFFYKLNLDVDFKKLNVNFTIKQHSKGYIQLISITEFDNLSFNHQKLANETIHFRNLQLQLIGNIHKHLLELDSTSKIIFNQFSFSPYLRYNNNERQILYIRIPETTFTAQDFINALPNIQFKCINGMKTLGKLSFTFEMNIPFDSIENIELNAQLKPQNFRILQYGQTNLHKLKDTFQIIRNEVGYDPVIIKVDSTSKTYTRLSEISKYLIFSVLTSEDGSFFYHRGFNTEAIANSIAENIQKKRFARGGSTITMQFVKNVFLSQKKTIARKFEEIILTWIIENTKIISKEKMLEIYLNIIEWGPNIYGIQQASQYYFNKKPSQLNLKESIFLASIIPSPKHFYSTFEKKNQLKAYYINYFQRMATIMLNRKQISESDTVNLNIDIELSGAAKHMLDTRLKHEDNDSIDMDKDNDFFYNKY